MKTKNCPMCKKSLPLQVFMNKRGEVVYTYCKSCTRDYKDRRAIAFAYKPAEECAICGIKFNENIAPHCDHDHSTGLFRDWLCSACNKGIGMFEENVERMQKAIEYIKKHFIEEADPNKF